MRALWQIALEIATGENPIPNSAKPYLAAMTNLETLSDKYGHDSAREIVLRFLCNAQMWRGETARRIKKELNTMLKFSANHP